MFLKRWFNSNLEEITDPDYKNEIKANRFLGAIFLVCATVCLIFMILFLIGLFTFENFNEVIILYSLIEGNCLIGFLISFFSKGKGKYVKYVLLILMTFIAVLLDMFLSFYAVLFLVVPLICAGRYAKKNICINIAVVLGLLILINGFIAYYTNIDFELSILDPSVIKIYLDDPSKVTYWMYTTPVLIYTVLPKLLIVAVIAVISVLNADNVKQFTDDASKTIKKEERINGELSLARSLQENMLPKVFPPFPEIKNFDIYADMIPAKEVGGDMYDFFLVDDQHLGLVIADVSGKGVPASLFMGMTKILIKNMLMQNQNLELAIASANDMLVNDNAIGLFVTAWIGVLDLNNGELRYVNAGHNPPLLYKDNTLSFLKDKSGISLGYMPRRQYKKYSIKLKPEDRLFLYTDGVTEATNNKNELYGEEALQKFITSHIKDTDKELISSLLEDINGFAKNEEQFDDITMVSLTFNSYLNKKNARKEFAATVDNFANVSEFIEETLTNFEVSLKFINQINIAVEEIFTNIAKYGYQGQSNGKALVDITLFNGVVTVTTYDNSPMFNPFAQKDPDITLAAEDRPIGGLGLLMVKKLMDDVSYKYENKTNIISLIKKV